jgi:hypothetical protein
MTTVSAPRRVQPAPDVIAHDASTSHANELARQRRLALVALAT